MSGDSQLIRIQDAPMESSSVEVVDVFENLGPVVDFALIKGRQSQVLTEAQLQHIFSFSRPSATSNVAPCLERKRGMNLLKATNGWIHIS